jgi:signal transduction histidine kinase
MIGRVFSVAAILLSIESSLNFLGQLKYLNVPLAMTIAVGLWITTISFFISYWFGSARDVYLRIHALYMFVLVAGWPLTVVQLPPTEPTFYPWIWWGVDTCWLAAALTFKLRWTVVYYIGLNAGIQYIFSLPVGGSHPISVTIPDFCYTLLTNATVAVVALLLRNAATQTDLANSEAIQTRMKQAAVDAAARERQRVDALVHDRVLTALISATNAKDVVQVKAAGDLANSAISKLQELQHQDPSGMVLTKDLFDSIVATAKSLDPALVTSITTKGNWLVEQPVASALTEATYQAVQNSMIHAGSKATRELFLKASDREIKIVVRDDGRGFRPNRVSKGRLGIQVSIIGRVESVGGRAHIASKPGDGTTVILEWSRP